MKTVVTILVVILVLIAGSFFYFTPGVHKVKKFYITIGKLDNNRFKETFRCPEGFAATFLIISDDPLPKSISGIFMANDNKSISKKIKFNVKQSDASIVSFKSSQKRYYQYPITNSEMLDFVANMEVGSVYNISLKLSQSVNKAYFAYAFTSSRIDEAKLAGAKQAPYWTGEKISDKQVD